MSRSLLPSQMYRNIHLGRFFYSGQSGRNNFICLIMFGIYIQYLRFKSPMLIYLWRQFYKITRRVREYVADSPFEYQKNCLLYLPKNLKTCRRESQEEAEMIAGHIHSLICSTYGHTLVLFTSYHLMGNVYQMLRDEIPFPMIEVWSNSFLLLSWLKNR